MPQSRTSPSGLTGRFDGGIREWFALQGWKTLPHQEEAWAKILEGESGLVISPTGAGKTYAAFLGFLPLLLEISQGLGLVYVTPLKALTRDIEKSLREALAHLAPDLALEARTGDTKSHVRQRQRRRPPPILVTTPESLALLLSYEDAGQLFGELRGVIVDEWHDLLGTKRGSLLELSLAHLRSLRPHLQIWGLSATLANPKEGAQALVGPHKKASIVVAPTERSIDLRTFWPQDGTKLPWAGHLGLKLAPQLASELSPETSTLIFTNTRSQAERWYEALTLLMPEWDEIMALHHGSLDPLERERVERGVKSGALRIVVCTASLDLGVDFPAVDRVVQIGSPKQLARLIQRAGRSAHRPGGTSDVWFVPTHALELVEASAFREALAQKRLEKRHPLEKPLDVLIQHVVSRALAGGITQADLAREIRDTAGFAAVTDEELRWVLRFVTDGGETLASYPQYRKVVIEGGFYRVKDRSIALRHRQNIGTITSDGGITVKLGRSKVLGTIEERFLAQVRPGGTFLFAGRWLTLVSLQDMTAYVRTGQHKKEGVIATWTGGSLPWSSELTESLRRVLDHYQKTGQLTGDVEQRALAPILETQAKLSLIPRAHELLVEVSQSREGRHLFVFPFVGKALHEGLAALWCLRLARGTPMTLSFAVNDYGLEILMDQETALDHLDWDALLSPDDASRDLEEALHLGELAKRHFRSIARVSGLIHQNLPGKTKTSRQVQTSSGLLFDVFQQFDPGNLLLKQARSEALRAMGDGQSLTDVLTRLQSMQVKVIETPLFSPLAFPLYVERVAGQMSSESLAQRIARMQTQWLKKPKKTPARR